MQEFKTDISVNGNQVKNVIIDQKDNFPPVSESYEGRKITLNGISYIFHNGAWQSVAEDLEGRNESHEEDFVFQPTANDLSVKDGFAKIKKIKGKSFAYNQLIPDDIYNQMELVSSSDATIERTLNSVKITNSGFEFRLYFKNILQRAGLYCFRGKIKNLFSKDNLVPVAQLSDIRVNLPGIKSQKELDFVFFKEVLNVSNNNYGGLLQIYYTENSLVEISDLQIFNVSEMFGNSILTYEEFNKEFNFGRKWPYNAGQLLSFNASSLKTVGFNAFNGEYAKVLGGQTYYLNGEYSLLGFKESIDSEVVAFNLPTDRLYTPATNGYIVAKGNNICINLSHSGFRNGEYLPYMDYNLSFDFIKTIKDSNNTLLFSDGELCSVGGVADEIYTISDKHYKAIKRIGKRAYQSGDENLENAITDKTNTLYVLDAPLESEVFEKELSYFEWDFGTEEIIPDQEDENTPTVPIRADIQYIFNAVDMIRNNYYLILETLKRLPKNINLDFWSLTQANAEVSACEVSINNSTESIFPNVLATYGNYIHSRNIIVDLSNYSDSSNCILDIFGDVTNVPTGIRYSIFLYGYANSLKIDFPLTYKTNITATHSPDGMSEERYTIAYSGATKIDFIKLNNDLVWVDVSSK